MEKPRQRTGKMISRGHLINDGKTFLEDSGPDDVVIYVQESWTSDANDIYTHIHNVYIQGVYVYIMYDYMHV